LIPISSAIINKIAEALNLDPVVRSGDPYDFQDWELVLEMAKRIKELEYEIVLLKSHMEDVR
jgi:hypothetical protein